MLVENYLPGALKKYKMDWETLKEVNPKLIYASITGYGQTGPYANRAGYDVMVEAYVSPLLLSSPSILLSAFLLAAILTEAKGKWDSCT